MEHNDAIDLILWLVVIIAILLLIYTSPTDGAFLDPGTQMYHYASEINDEPVEYMYLFDQAGRVVLGVKGNETCVLVPWYMFYLFPDKIAIHNHPNGCVYVSEADYEFFNLSELNELWVVTDTQIRVLHKGGIETTVNWTN